MKTMKIFEPAMCCPTGVCGVGVDPELLRISTVLNILKENGIEIQRFNLTSAPSEFINNKMVAEYLQKFGPDKLPVTMIDDFIVIAGRYPTNDEFVNWLELPANVLKPSTSCCDVNSEADNCCCSSGCCSDDCCSDDCCSDDCCSDNCCSDDCCSDGCC